MKKIYQAPTTYVVKVNAEHMIANSIKSISGADGFIVGGGTSDLEEGTEASVKSNDWSNIWD